MKISLLPSKSLDEYEVDTTTYVPEIAEEEKKRQFKKNWKLYESKASEKFWLDYDSLAAYQWSALAGELLGRAHRFKNLAVYVHHVEYTKEDLSSYLSGQVLEACRKLDIPAPVDAYTLATDYGSSKRTSPMEASRVESVLIPWVIATHEESWDPNVYPAIVERARKAGSWSKFDDEEAYAVTKDMSVRKAAAFLGWSPATVQKMKRHFS